MTAGLAGKMAIVLASLVLRERRVVMFGDTLFTANGPQRSPATLVDEVSEYVRRGATLTSLSDRPASRRKTGVDE